MKKKGITCLLVLLSHSGEIVSYISLATVPELRKQTGVHSHYRVKVKWTVCWHVLMGRSIQKNKKKKAINVRDHEQSFNNYNRR